MPKALLDEQIATRAIKREEVPALGMPVVRTCSQEDRIQGWMHLGRRSTSRRTWRGGEWSAREQWLTAASTMLAELVQDWNTPVGRELVQLLFASAPMQPVD